MAVGHMTEHTWITVLVMAAAGGCSSASIPQRQGDGDGTGGPSDGGGDGAAADEVPAVVPCTAPTEWEPARDITPGVSYADYPGLGVDRSGGVHVVWNQGRILGDRLDPTSCEAHYRRLGSGPLDLSNEPERDDYGIRLAMGPPSVMHAVWHSAEAVPGVVGAKQRSKVMYARNSGGTWAPPLTISGDIQRAVVPAVAVDSGGTAHVVHLGVRLEPPRLESVHYQSIRDTSSVDSVPLVEVMASVFEPLVTATASGQVYVAWGVVDTRTELVVAVLQEGIWSEPRVVSTSSDWLIDEQLVVDRNDVAQLVWSAMLDGRARSYRTYLNGSRAWEQDELPVAGGHRVRLAFDPSNRPHVVWFDCPYATPDKGCYAYHSFLNAGSWSAPALLSYPTGIAWGPAIAADDTGLVHVAWEFALPWYNHIHYTTRCFPPP
ncbi:MAG: hypothetical protein HY903_01360 [Deltaproteobacteria bacterium]|nr:hypothetical protein [Deltaproteobacteria bacterium]